MAGLCLAAGLLTISCGKSTANRPASREEAHPVEVAHAALRSMEKSIPVTGSLFAQEQSVLSAKVSGRLDELRVDVGSVVQRGELIAQIERRDYELNQQQAAAALAQARAVLGLPLDGTADDVALEQVSSVKEAKAILDEASKNLARVKDLSSARISSQSELDVAQAAQTVAATRYERALDAARGLQAELAQRLAEYETAGKRLADTSVRAPFDGAVQARAAGLGEYLGAGAPIVTFVKIDPLRLRLEVPERESIQVRLGQAIRLRIEGDTNTYQGRIARISPALNELNRMLLVEADVPRTGALRPGLFARADIVVSDHEDVISVPENAIVTFAGLEKVIGIQNGKAVERTVRTGRRMDGFVEVVTGVEPGDEVVLEPGGLRTGQPVAVMADQTRSSPAASALSSAETADVNRN